MLKTFSATDQILSNFRRFYVHLNSLFKFPKTIKSLTYQQIFEEIDKFCAKFPDSTHRDFYIGTANQVNLTHQFLLHRVLRYNQARQLEQLTEFDFFLPITKQTGYGAARQLCQTQPLSNSFQCFIDRGLNADHNLLYIYHITDTTLENISEFD